MIKSLIEIIIIVLVCGVVYWAIEQLLPLIPLPPPFMQIIRVLLVVLIVVIALYVVIDLLGLFTGIHISMLALRLIG